ncbi:MAG: hypothetical protein H0T96_06910 [Thermoleophilaceae bacterium]|jgi:hypothetical protein|nr:hypothetical protein [Thermoleophilaceae bacterium]
MEIRLRFTIAEHGFDPENGERYMDAFMTSFAEGGPSIAQNLQDGTLTVTFAFDAEGVNEGVTAAIDIFERGIDQTGLPRPDVLDVEASVVSVDESEGARELEPA